MIASCLTSPRVLSITFYFLVRLKAPLWERSWGGGGGRGWWLESGSSRAWGYWEILLWATNHVSAEPVAPTRSQAAVGQTVTLAG